MANSYDEATALIPNPMDEISLAARNNQAEIGLPVLGDTTEVLDLSNDPRIVPMPMEGEMPELDIGIPPLGPTAQEVNDAHEVLDAQNKLQSEQAQPQMVDKVVGKTSTSTTQTERSPASMAAELEGDSAAQDLKAGLAAEAKADQELNKVQAEKEAADNNAIASIENARAAVQMKNQAKFQNDLAQIDGKVAELSNWKPETFWGSKSASDKVAASLSVGLGAFSQALLGSGQNIGAVLLDRQMNEFDRNQQADYNNKLKAIQNMKASLDEKQELADDLEKTFDARKIAARAKVQGDYAKALATAKTPQVQAQLQQRMAKVDQDLAKSHMETASKYEQKSTVNTERDIIKQVQQTAGVTKEGKPLNVEQAKALGFHSQMALSAKNIDKFDEQALVSRGSVGNYMRNIEYNAASADIPVMGKALAAGRLMLGDTAEDRVKKADPEAYNYVQQAQGFVNAVLRRESGASIADPEFMRTFRQYFPADNDGPDEVREKAERRRQAIQDMKTSTGL